MNLPLGPKLPLTNGVVGDKPVNWNKTSGTPSMAADFAEKLITDVPTETRQNLKNLILTAPGEKISDAQFGAGLRRYVFSMQGNLRTGSLMAKIRAQVKNYMPFIEVEDIRVETMSDETAVRVSIFYFITPLGVSDSLDLNFDSYLTVAENYENSRYINPDSPEGN